MSTRNERFNQRFCSIDAISGRVDIDKRRHLSDRGRGVRDIVLGCDGGEAMLARRQERKDSFRHGRIGPAIRTLLAKGLHDAALVTSLVFKNGNNRKESIWEILKILRRRKSGR